MKRTSLPPRPIDKLLLQPERYIARKRQAERADKLAARRAAESKRGK